MSRRYNRGGLSEASGGTWEEERPRGRDVALRDGARRTVLVMGPGARRGAHMGSPGAVETSPGFQERPHGNSPVLTARQGPPPPTDSGAPGASGGPGGPGSTRKLPFMALSDIIRQQNIKGKLHGQQQHQLQQQERSPSPTRSQQQQQRQDQPQQQQQQHGSARNALFGSERANAHGRGSSGGQGPPLGEHRRVRDLSGGPSAASESGGRSRGPRSAGEGATHDTPRTLHLRERPSCSPPAFRGPSVDRSSDRESRRPRGGTRAAESGARERGEGAGPAGGSLLRRRLGAPRGPMGGIDGRQGRGVLLLVQRRREQRMQGSSTTATGHLPQGAIAGAPGGAGLLKRGAPQASPHEAVMQERGPPGTLGGNMARGPTGGPTGGPPRAAAGTDTAAAAKTLRGSGDKAEGETRNIEKRTTAPINKPGEIGAPGEEAGPRMRESPAAAAAANALHLQCMRNNAVEGIKGAGGPLSGPHQENVEGPQEDPQVPLGNPTGAQQQERLPAPQGSGRVGPEGAPSRGPITRVAVAGAAAAADRRACISDDLE
ncbi:uncharacterized protein EMH_0026980 [Eimeria mitis]|uniref:Uncharacterized protein n=1 Tax=Eimeria mitis TaxID=44415 RepID=U6KC21_9EIME|nr:uncharacterized protein EMH_0026980 [Eimeria mitis]CDJ35570.1 hypothetical protein EMH_0026980 [Eimeria mitis]